MLPNLRVLRNFDWIIFTIAFLLFAIGVSLIYSTTFGVSGSGKEALQQGVLGLIALVGLMVVSFIDYRIYRNISGILYLLTIFILGLVLILGIVVNEARSWIDVGFFRFQPSEFAKLFIIIAMAKFFSERAEQMHKFKNILISGLYFFIPTILVAIQPDFGTASVFFAVWLAMILVSRVQKKHLVIVGACALMLIPVGWLVLEDYQRARITTFLDANSDPSGSGYNVSQAKIAIGSGKLFGRGLGHGPQSQLNFIPEKHTDFIFAALAEETGFLGVFLVVGLFGGLIFRALYIAANARDYFGMYLGTGVVAMLSFHIFLNIGMNIGIAPVTGIPLPLISLGGSSVVVVFILLGILESIHIRRKKIDF